MTPDQLARVERLRDAATYQGAGGGGPLAADADALTALLREREAMRAALRLLATAGRDASLSEGALRHIVLMIADPSPVTEDDIARTKELIAQGLLTGTTARTEGE